MQKVFSIIMSIIAFFMQLLGLGSKIDYTNLTDIPYGKDPNQVFDLALPSNSNTDTSLFVCIHGGSWSGGDKTDEKNTAIFCVKNLRMPVASLNYRFLDEKGTVRCGKMLDDITSGITVAIEKAREQGFNIKGVAIGGFSAGGHLALMYSYLRADEDDQKCQRHQ